MSENSDCEEFYDAEDLTPTKNSKKRTSIHQVVPAAAEPTQKTEDFKVPLPPPEPPQLPPNHSFKVPLPQTDSASESSSADTIRVAIPTRKSADDVNEAGRKWFQDLRQQMLTDEDDIANNPSPPDSQASSVEGVFPSAPSKASHPFRIIEHDGASVHSMTSLGRVGRILSGSDATAGGGESPLYAINLLLLPAREAAGVSGSTSVAPTHITRDASPGSTQSSRSASTAATPTSTPTPTPTIPSLPFLEPDVIASAKNSKSTEASAIVPVAPPRKKKKKEVTPSEPKELVLPLPSPASTIESLTRELEHSLDIKAVTKGQYVVKPQDEAMAKAEGPPLQSLAEPEPLERIKHEVIPTRDRGIQIPPPHSSNSIGRTSINSSNALSLSHFTGVNHGSVNSAGHEGGMRLNVSPRGSRERRRSAGDEQAMLSQLNMFVRTRTDSGKQLSDLEILEQVTVLNLDTGERVPLSVAEDKLPQGINPLSLHIMRLTSEYVSNPSLQEKESDEESVDSKMAESVVGGRELQRVQLRRRTDRFKKFLGTTVRKTMDKAKSIAQEVSHSRHREDIVDMADDMSPGETYIKLKVSNSHKGPYDFDSLQVVQDLSGQHQGPVWCMKFSACGRLLATAGQDRVLRVWVLRSAYQHFQDMRTKYNAEKVSPTPSQESLVSQQSAEEPPMDVVGASVGPFMPRPFCTYTGHTSDLLDLAWSKNYFVLSSSMDKTVRLWHISRKECLCCFQHIDFVTAIVFHPRDDRYFLSGSLDGKLRLWNIPDKKVAVWNELDGRSPLITAANFCQNGKFAVVGTYDGRCIFYNTDQLKYHTTIDVRSSRGKNATGRKISGVEPMPGEDKILVTSNDSRIRLYDLRDLSLTCKYKGYVNVSSQIKASFSHDGKYILSGSENQCLYIWKTNHEYFKFSSVRRDRNDYWEGVKAHNAVVTAAVFAPHPDILLQELEEKGAEPPTSPPPSGYAFVSADFNGCIKVFINKMKPKHSSLPASALA